MCLSPAIKNLLSSILGRARKAGVFRAGSKGSDHRPARIAGGCPYIPTAARGGRDGAVEGQPAFRVDV